MHDHTERNREMPPHHGRNDHPDRPARRTGSIFWGVILIALGILFTLERLEVVDHRLVENWWPVLLIALGLAWGAYALAGVGTWLLISELHLFGLSYSTSWPVILIVIGLGTIIHAFQNHRCIGHDPSLPGGRK